MNKREMAHKVSRLVEEFLELRRDATAEECKEIISKVVERTLVKSQKHIAADLDVVAKIAGGNLADDMQRSLFELANNTWYDHARQDMLIVPQNTRFLHRQADRLHLAVEEEPDVRTVKYVDDDGRETKFRIATPFCLFVFPITSYQDNNGNNRYKIEGGRLAFTRSKLTSLEDRLYYPCLPNIDTRTNKGQGDWLKICMGGQYHPDYAHQNITQQIDTFIAYYWQAPFGTDWDQEYKSMIERDRRFKMENWAKETIKNPLFVLGNDCLYREAGMFRELVISNVGRDNNLHVPLKKIVKRATDNISSQVIKLLAKAEVINDFDPKHIDKALYEVMCSTVRHCIAELENDLVMTSRQEHVQEKDRLDSNLTELLLELNKKVNSGPEPGEKENYWWS